MQKKWRTVLSQGSGSRHVQLRFAQQAQKLFASSAEDAVHFCNNVRVCNNGTTMSSLTCERGWRTRAHNNKMDTLFFQTLGCTINNIILLFTGMSKKTQLIYYLDQSTARQIVSRNEITHYRVNKIRAAEYIIHVFSAVINSIGLYYISPF